jgi:type III secretory pathway component EscU
MPESKDLPSSLVTVWPTWVILVQVTFVPTLTVSVAGLKAKLPLLSVVMVTAWPLLAAVVAVGVVPAVVAVGVFPVAGVDVEPEPEVVPPPQAAKRTSASRTSHTL